MIVKNDWDLVETEIRVASHIYNLNALVIKKHKFEKWTISEYLLTAADRDALSNTVVLERSFELMANLEQNHFASLSGLLDTSLVSKVE